MRLIRKKTKIDFLGPKRRKIALSISALLVVVSLVSLGTRGLDFGIDFTGGILLEVGYEQPADLEKIRNNLSDAGFQDAQVQLFGRETDVLVRLPPQPRKVPKACGSACGRLSRLVDRASSCGVWKVSVPRLVASLPSAARSRWSWRYS